MSHIHHLLLLLKAAGRRNGLARNSRVTCVWAATSQPAAHPYMEPCPVRTITRKRAEGVSAQRQTPVYDAPARHSSVRVVTLFTAPWERTMRIEWKRTRELTPVQTVSTETNFSTCKTSNSGPLSMRESEKMQTGFLRLCL